MKPLYNHEEEIAVDFGGRALGSSGIGAIGGAPRAAAETRCKFGLLRGVLFTLVSSDVHAITLARLAMTYRRDPTLRGVPDYLVQQTRSASFFFFTGASAETGVEATAGGGGGGGGVKST
jgi:hypothetical protein